MLSVFCVCVHCLGGIIKDVTKRYASDCLSQMRKLRIDPGWWEDTLKAYGPKTAAEAGKDAAEETQLEGDFLFIYLFILLLLNFFKDLQHVVLQNQANSCHN